MVVGLVPLGECALSLMATCWLTKASNFHLLNTKGRWDARRQFSWLTNRIEVFPTSLINHVYINHSTTYDWFIYYGENYSHMIDCEKAWHAFSHSWLVYLSPWHSKSTKVTSNRQVLPTAVHCSMSIVGLREVRQTWRDLLDNYAVHVLLNINTMHNNKYNYTYKW